MSPSIRSFGSALRANRVARLRRRILDAAAACYSTNGYPGTTLTHIAREARVSIDTVLTVGRKRELLVAAFQQAYAGTEGQQSPADNEDAPRIAAVPDQGRYLEAVASFVAAANARTSMLWGELLSAANSDDRIAESVSTLLARRRDDYRALATSFISRGLVSWRANEQELDELADELSFLWAPEAHRQLVLESGWSMEKYTRWLVESVQRQFA